jgi:hypothetical protein
MTDADLTALWSAWLRDRAQIHKMIHLTSAMFRAHAEAVAAAARRSPPAADAPIGRVESWEDGRGPNSNVPNVPMPPEVTCAKCGVKAAAFICSTPGCPVNGGAAHPADERGSFAGLVRGPDGSLEPAGFTCPNLGHQCRPGCHAWDGTRCHNLSLADIAPPATGGVTHAYPADAMPAGLKKACEHRPEAAFGAPMTVYGSAGPYRPTNPEDDGA